MGDINTIMETTPSTSDGPVWNTQENDAELTSFIDALWDEQLADGTFDLSALDHQQARASLGSFGDLHILDSKAPSNTQAESEAVAFSDTSPFDYDAHQKAQPPQHLWQSPESMHIHGSFESPYHITQPSLPAAFDNSEAYDDYSSSRAPSQAGTANSVDTTEASEPCYARLLYTCLRETPGNTLSLKEIYAWIRMHTQKARDPKNKGWQNSVRHNLSMNAAFERVTISRSNGETKKGSLWRLTPQAMRDGVISTTRYRRDPKRKSIRRGAPAPQRQLSGAKGGAATRAASHARRQHQQIHECMMRDAHSRAQQRFFTSAPAPPHAPALLPSYQPMPSSPYFVSSNETSPMLGQLSYSSPHTPVPVQLSFDQQQKGMLQDFQLQHIDYNQDLFGNTDNVRDYTPSLQTDSSCFTDELMSAPTSSHMML